MALSQTIGDIPIPAIVVIVGEFDSTAAERLAEVVAELVTLCGGVAHIGPTGLPPGTEAVAKRIRASRLPADTRALAILALLDPSLRNAVNRIADALELAVLMR